MFEDWISEEWKYVLAKEFEQPYFYDLEKAISLESLAGSVFPTESNVFNAFSLTPLSQVKVVILGQDPYHKAGQAEGLSFSVPKGVKIPHSLRNIFKELERDLEIAKPEHGHLAAWAKQGVLLLNSTLTVSEGRPNSHSKLGWQRFTDTVIRKISERQEAVVFMLWGNFAQSKRNLIDTKKHLVLEAAHPSPLSARRGFLGCGHFSKANEWLAGKGFRAIDWIV
ncbi:MAG: uracil-DNA glycosylase [Chitinophagaceae bacterium]